MALPFQISHDAGVFHVVSRYCALVVGCCMQHVLVNMWMLPLGMMSVARARRATSLFAELT